MGSFFHVSGVIRGNPICSTFANPE